MPCFRSSLSFLQEGKKEYPQVNDFLDKSKLSSEMNGDPGHTLFEPGEQVMLNHNFHDEDDEEEKEDERRREEELRAELEHAFDDYMDDEGNGELSSSSDEEQTPENSGLTNTNGGRAGEDQFQPIFNHSDIEKNETFQPIFTVNSSNETAEDLNNKSDEAYRQAEFNSVEQLQVLLEVRMREIQRLTHQLEEEQRNMTQQKQETLRRLALMEAEKERAILSRTEATKLLVSKSEEIENLQEELQTLRQTLAAIEKDKKKSDELAEISKLQIQELEQRIALMERCDPSKIFIKETDVMIRDLKNKHQQEVHLLQRQVDSMSKKLQKKDEECGVLEGKVTDLQRAQELLLVEKSSTINQLSRTVEESQEQCRQLMSSNLSVENVRLQNQLDDALREKQQLSQTLNSLQVECKMMQTDLAQYESVTRLTMAQTQSSSDETDSIIQMGFSSRHSQTRSLNNINQSDMMSKLRDELHRALLNQKAKRAEIERLRELVNSKEHQIQNMTKQEQIYLAKTEKLNVQLNKVMAELTSLHEKQEKTDDLSCKTEEVLKLQAEIGNLQKEKSILEKEKFEVQQKLDDLMVRFESEKRREVSDYNKEYLKFHDETVAKVKKEAEEEANLKIKGYSIRLEQSLKEVSEVKEMYVAVCAAKEQLVHSVDEVSTQLQQVKKERDQLAKELKEVSSVREQLAKQLNEKQVAAVVVTRIEDSQTQHSCEEKERLQASLDKCVEMRDVLARRVNHLKTENDKLNEEIKKLRTEFKQNVHLKNENQVCEECAQLREQMTAMSSRHTQELSAARTELQTARDRVLQLEKCARLQFDTEIKTLRQDRDMLKIKCDEKEIQIKKLIESRKRPPAMVSVAIETDQRWPNNISRVGGGDNTLAVLDQEALESARSRSKEDIEELKEKHNQMLGKLQRMLEQQEMRHREELHAVEERTKQLTVQFFAAEVKRLEAYYIEQASHLPDPAVLQALHNTLADKTAEINSLKQRLASLDEEWQQKVTALQRQMEADKDSASQLMVQWVQEVKNMQGELKLKEAIIDDQRLKLEKAKSTAKIHRKQFMKTNQELRSKYNSRCTEYKTKMLEILDNSEKEVFKKVKQLEEIYENREKELKKIIRKTKQTT